jgi:integrase
LLRRSKTDQYGSGKWIHLSTETTCALHDWLEASGIQDGFLLREIDAKERLTASLSVERVSKIFKTIAERAKLDECVVNGISGHSMRVGGAQDLLVQGASLPQIMVKGGWVKTDTVMRYVERVRAPLPRSP